MRLCFYMHDMSGGGAERVFALVTSGMARQGHEVCLALNHAVGPNLEFLDPRVRIIDLDRRTQLALPSLIRVLRETHPECVLSGLSHNNLVAALACRRVGVPFIATVHSIESLHARNFKTSGITGTLAHYLSGIVYRSAAAIAPVSNAAARDIPYFKIAPTKFHVLWNPVDTRVFTPDGGGASTDPAPLPRTAGRARVLTLGRLDEKKNFPLLIDALALLVGRLDAELVILGEGPERASLLDRVRRLGLQDRVHLPGYVADPVAYYRSADVVALSSRYEGFGNSIIEAFATGKPVVSVDCAGAPAELIGDIGTLVPQDDPAAMARALEQAITTAPPAARLLARAQEFSVESTVARYEKVIASVVAADRSRRRSGPEALR